MCVFSKAYCTFLVMDGGGAVVVLYIQIAQLNACGALPAMPTYSGRAAPWLTG